MADTILLNIGVAPNLKKRKTPIVKILPRKKVRIIGKNGKECLPSFDQFHQFVDGIGQEQIASVYAPSRMAKLGLAVMKFGIDSKQVKQAKAETTKASREATVQFLGCLHKIYMKQLEKYKTILDLPTCCICLASTDDFEIRDNYASRKRKVVEEEAEDEDPAKVQFVKLSNLPTGTSYPKGLKCNCKNTAICMPCFLKLIRVGEHQSVRVQCPTCRVVFCFKVGVLDVGQVDIIIIDGIKPSDEVRGYQCPFRIPRVEEPDSESSSDDDEENQIPRHSSRPDTPPLPRVYSPHSPPYSPSHSPFQPPSGVFTRTPSPPPRVHSPPCVRKLRPSTMNLRDRNRTKKEKLHFLDYDDDSDSDSDSDAPTEDSSFFHGAPLPTTRRKTRQRYSEAGNLILKDKDYIVVPEDPKEEKPEKPEDGGIGYNHHPKWPKVTNKEKRGEFRFLPRKGKN